MLAQHFLTFTSSEDVMISQRSINDFPKMYNLSFFGTTTEQTKRRSGATTLFGVAETVEPISLIRKVTKRIKRQLDMSLNAECETVHMKKIGPQCVHVSGEG